MSMSNSGAAGYADVLAAWFHAEFGDVCIHPAKGMWQCRAWGERFAASGPQALAEQVVRTGTEDQRDPTTCPKCGEVCTYDGWGHVHGNGIGIGSCARTGTESEELGVLRDFWYTFWEDVTTVECACGLSAYEHEDATRLEHAQDKVAAFYEGPLAPSVPDGARETESAKRSPDEH